MEVDGQIAIIARVGLAALLGAIIGLERELKGKPAGLRTHLLVCAAAALFVELGNVMIDRFEHRQLDQILRSDPIRIIEAVVTGISFIGAGTILFHRGKERLEGVTTAASILITAAIGVAVGLEAYLVAVGLTLFVGLVLWGLGLVVQAIGRRRRLRRGSDDDRGEKPLDVARPGPPVPGAAGPAGDTRRGGP